MSKDSGVFADFALEKLFRLDWSACAYWTTVVVGTRKRLNQNKIDNIVSEMHKMPYFAC